MGNLALTAKTNNYIYKIWDISKSKYISTGNKSKNSWKSKTWAETAIKELCENQAHYANANPSSKYINSYNYTKIFIDLLKNYEIHKMELVINESYNAAYKIINKENIDNQIKIIDNLIVQIEDGIEKLFDNKLQIFKIRELMNSGDSIFTNQLTVNYELEYDKIKKLRNKQSKLRESIKEL